MGIYLDGADSNKKMRTWGLRRLKSRSDVYGRTGLDHIKGLFVGLAPEALQKIAGTLESILGREINAALKLKKSFAHNGTVYVPVADESIKLQ